MNALDELAATLVAVRGAFDSLGVTWAVGGSLASAAYGEPRATNDVDVIVLQKLRWYRIGGETSDRQWRDIVSVVRGGALDDAHLDAIAGATGLAALLARAREAAR